ncbi:MAG: 3-keto-5-aminohexanoate cleavage protein [Rhodospirillales bacterium]|jgi:3-keto-5-aminohexanoate cleavage enzyme|nr:3-keto-5-aminohexanoate cleavage protein [Rhodospirillales bacterium]MBT4625919.1 3-keto-5-aminohexanoate cleavage protein [Rhodospirillales bacterium]MBT5351208.1 3-keto-5-aminohexanoate cleavage protein [Rhodospirillales bacterium]MBT5522322.1 3-keto-5-aminohexanoate cleavage protein [Rhodospirillales bacterium]MBT6108620.1 3-keto-5-aminohexanoate cleavage protein [Rhodospirillales bacterium]
MTAFATKIPLDDLSTDAAWQPLIIAVAPNGARRTKVDHPSLPMTARESADEAVQCRDAGASMIHLHVRDRDGGHSLDADLYRGATSAIRAAVGDDVIIQVTTEAVGIYSAAEQMAMVRDVRPEAISTAVRELVPDEAAERGAAEFYTWAARENIAVQFILYDGDDVMRFSDLRKRGVIPGDVVSVLYVLGRYAKDQKSRPSDLLEFMDAARSVSADWHWSMCAFGPLESACALSAASFGGHVRVGMENNLYLSDGTLTPGNAALVHQVLDGATLLGRPVATAAQAREILASPVAGVL